MNNNRDKTNSESTIERLHQTNASHKKQSLRGKNGVYKRGDVWLAVVEYPKDEKTGKRKRVWLRDRFRTRKEAEAARDGARNEVRRGVDIVPEKMTVAELIQRWLGTKVKLEATTHERYDGIANINIIPHIGSIKITQLRPAHIQELYTLLLTSGRGEDEDGNPIGLSPTTVGHVHALLKAVFAWAVRMQVLARNVVEAISNDDLPQRIHNNAEALTDDEVAKLMDAVAGQRWAVPIALALATGMRRGELSALLWEDVDLEARTVTVSASLSQTKSRGVQRKTTKTGRVRIIPLSPFAYAVLRERRTQYVEERLEKGESFNDEGYVVADEFGRPYTPLELTEAFRKTARAAKIPKRLHDLRHTAATFLLGSGVDVRTVATLLGHSAPSTTMNIYSHQLAGLKEAAIGKLDDRLQVAITKGRGTGK